MSSVSKEVLARELGYGGDLAPLDEALEEAGLSRPDRRNIAEDKRPAVAAVIAERFLLVCNRGDCRAEAEGDDRRVVPASDPAHCEVCGGSPVASALQQMTDACRDAGLRRVVIVGGSPATRARIQRDLPADAPELRLVDGTRARTRTEADGDLAWADLVVVWAGTELAHKATMAYPVGHPRILTVTRRGIPALARAIARHAHR